MKILLVSGEEHSYVSERVAESRHIVVNKKALTLDCVDGYIAEHCPTYDVALITDGALSANPDENEADLALLADRRCKAVVLTRDFCMEAPDSVIKIFVSEWARAVHEDFDNALGLYQPQAPAEKAEKRKWGFKPKKTPEADEPLTSANIDRTSSRAIVFTGHRGAGVTSTAVNVALSAVSRKLKTILVDLDTDYRAVNLYFGEFGTQADEDDSISSSLIRLLAQPHKYDTYAVNADGLWLTSLGYDFADEKLLQQHLTETKLNGLITALRHSFDLIILDFPLDNLAKNTAVLSNVDLIALCMENNIYSAFTTIRNITVGLSDSSDIAYLVSKSKIVVTKFNDEALYDGEPIMPERLGELIVNEGFCDEITTEMPLAGNIPYDKRFDRQIESDVAVIHTDNLMKQAYDGILLRLLGAVR
ncbi:MAG: AAA family ATPase [Defluviitaleaceae bacterium]|nr:AAA family ATPase [Defluviitaleaceae bacterium]